MTNNLNQPTVPEANPLMETPVQTDPVRTDGYNEAVKQGNSMKIVLLVVIFLIFGVLVAYILMNYLGGDEEPEVVTPTAVPTVEATSAVIEPTVTPPGISSGYKDFTFPAYIPDNKDNPFTISGKALEDSESAILEDEGSVGFTISGEEYQLNVKAYFESQNTPYKEYFFLERDGADTIARVKHDYIEATKDLYKYVRSDDVSETIDCKGMGPEDIIPAPCGQARYTSYNQVETFYILDITCDADAENVTKCDEIVKSLEIQY